MPGMPGIPSAMKGDGEIMFSRYKQRHGGSKPKTVKEIPSKRSKRSKTPGVGKRDYPKPWIRVKKADRENAAAIVEDQCDANGRRQLEKISSKP